MVYIEGRLLTGGGVEDEWRRLIKGRPTCFDMKWVGRSRDICGGVIFSER